LPSNIPIVESDPFKISLYNANPYDEAILYEHFAATLLNALEEVVVDCVIHSQAGQIASGNATVGHTLVGPIYLLTDLLGT
jgi:hypothetical protein